MSSGYGTVRSYHDHDDPRHGDSQEYRDNPFAGPPSARGYQSEGSASSAVQELCGQIESNIYQINSGANAVERALKSIGTNRDTPSVRDKIHETSVNTNDKVKATTKLIRTAIASKGDRSQRIMLDRLTNDFHESVARFQTLQKQATERVKRAGRVGTQPRTTDPQPLVDVAGFEGGGDHQPLLQEDVAADLQAQEGSVEEDLTLIREREERIRQLESDILDVNEIFRDLGTMVYEQGQVLNDIESNVQSAADNVNSGNQQLSKAAQYQRKSRRKQCCLLLILLLVATVVAVIIVVAVKTS
ncbi:hypothetical protein ACOMHN_058526 [Nucella lapillus]